MMIRSRENINNKIKEIAESSMTDNAKMLGLMTLMLEVLVDIREETHKEA